MPRVLYKAEIADSAKTDFAAGLPLREIVTKYGRDKIRFDFAPEEAPPQGQKWKYEDVDRMLGRGSRLGNVFTQTEDPIVAFKTMQGVGPEVPKGQPVMVPESLAPVGFKIARAVREIDDFVSISEKSRKEGMAHMDPVGAEAAEEEEKAQAALPAGQRKARYKLNGEVEWKDFQHLPEGVASGVTAFFATMPGLALDMVTTAMGQHTAAGRAQNEFYDDMARAEYAPILEAERTGQRYAAIPQRVWVRRPTTDEEWAATIFFQSSQPEGETRGDAAPALDTISPDHKAANLAILRAVRSGNIPDGLPQNLKGSPVIPIWKTYWINMSDPQQIREQIRYSKEKWAKKKEDPLFGEHAFIPTFLESYVQLLKAGPEYWIYHPVETILMLRGGGSLVAGIMRAPGAALSTLDAYRAFKTTPESALLDTVRGVKVEGVEVSPTMTLRRIGRMREAAAAANDGAALSVLDDVLAKTREVQAKMRESGKALASALGQDEPLTVIAKEAARIREATDPLAGVPPEARIPVETASGAKVMREVASETNEVLGAPQSPAAEALTGAALRKSPPGSSVRGTIRRAVDVGTGLLSKAAAAPEALSAPFQAGEVLPAVAEALQWGLDGMHRIAQRGAMKSTLDALNMRATSMHEALTAVQKAARTPGPAFAQANTAMKRLQSAERVTGPAGVLQGMLEHFKDTIQRLHPDVYWRSEEVDILYRKAMGDVAELHDSLLRNPGSMAYLWEVWRKGTEGYARVGEQDIARLSESKIAEATAKALEKRGEALTRREKKAEALLGDAQQALAKARTDGAKRGIRFAERAVARAEQRVEAAKGQAERIGQQVRRQVIAHEVEAAAKRTATHFGLGRSETVKGKAGPKVVRLPDEGKTWRATLEDAAALEFAGEFLYRLPTFGRLYSEHVGFRVPEEVPPAVMLGYLKVRHPEAFDRLIAPIRKLKVRQRLTEQEVVAKIRGRLDEMDAAKTADPSTLPPGEKRVDAAIGMIQERLPAEWKGFGHDFQAASEFLAVADELRVAAGEKPLDLQNTSLSLMARGIRRAEPEQVRRIAVQAGVSFKPETPVELIRHLTEKKLRSSSSVPDTLLGELFTEDVLADPTMKPTLDAVRADYEAALSAGPAGNPVALDALRGALVDRVRNDAAAMEAATKASGKSVRTAFREELERRAVQYSETPIPSDVPPEALVDAYLGWWRGHRAMWIPAEMVGSLMHSPSLAELGSPLMGFLRREIQRELAAPRKTGPGIGPATISTQFERRVAPSSKPPGDVAGHVGQASTDYQQRFPRVLEADEAAEVLTRGVVFGNSGAALLSRRMMLDAMEQLIRLGERLPGSVYIGPMHWFRFHNYFPGFYEDITVKTPEGTRQTVPVRIEKRSARESFAPSGAKQAPEQIGGVFGRGSLRKQEHGPVAARRLTDPSYIFARGMSEMYHDIAWLEYSTWLLDNHPDLFKAEGSQLANWSRISDVTAAQLRKSRVGKEVVEPQPGRPAKRLQLPTSLAKTIDRRLAEMGVEPGGVAADQYRAAMRDSFQETPAYGPLAGLYTSPEMHAMLVRGRGWVEESTAQAYRKATGVAKLALGLQYGADALLLRPFKAFKILWSPPTYLRNFGTNLEVSTLLGMTTHPGGWAAMRRLLAERASRDPAVRSRLQRDLHEAGFDDSAFAHLEMYDKVPDGIERQATPLAQADLFAEQLANLSSEYRVQAHELSPTEYATTKAIEGDYAGTLGRAVDAAVQAGVKGVKNPVAAATGLWNRVNGTLGRAYAAGDTLFKVWTYRWITDAGLDSVASLRDVYRTIGYSDAEIAGVLGRVLDGEGNVRPAALKAAARDEALKWFYDYSRVNSVVKHGRSGIIGALVGQPFWTYATKAAPRTFELLRRNPHKALMLNLAGMARTTAMMRYDPDMDPATARRLLGAVAPEERAAFWMMPGVQEEYVVVNPQDPREKQVVRKQAFMRGVSWAYMTPGDIWTGRTRQFEEGWDRFLHSLPEVFSPSASMGLQILDVVRGRDPYTGAPLPDDWGVKGEKAWEIFGPSWWPTWPGKGYSWKARERAIMQQPDDKGRFMDLTDVYYRYLFAYRVQSINFDTARYRALKSYDAARAYVATQYGYAIKQAKETGATALQAQAEKERGEKLEALRVAYDVRLRTLTSPPLDDKARRRLWETHALRLLSAGR